MSYFVTNTSGKAHHREGDVWEEGGKTWTINNGIKKSLGKLDTYRKQLVMPIACSHCGQAMKSQIDKPVWQVYKMCANCVIDLEHKIHTQGKWEEYEQALVKANMESRYNHLEDFIKEFIVDTTNKVHVTEDGAVENWIDNTRGVAEKVGAEVLSNFKKQIEELK